MAHVCGVCQVTDSKYKCPACELRYCSIKCYKPHKTLHEAEKPKNEPNASAQNSPPKRDRPGTTQRVPKHDFTGLEQDAEFQRLLRRYPQLRIQLQAVYALTIDPGPDEERTWNRQPLPSLERPTSTWSRGPRGRARGSLRGRGGFTRGGRGGWRQTPEDRQMGRWTREKGDKEALQVIQRMSDEKVEDDRAEGMREFIELIQMRTGNRETNTTATGRLAEA